jgi:type I restriction enzyme R subunit
MRAVFGDYIFIYYVQRAVADKDTVLIYYESRISKLGRERRRVAEARAEFEEITEGEELTENEKRKTK